MLNWGFGDEGGLAGVEKVRTRDLPTSKPQKETATGGGVSSARREWESREGLTHGCYAY